MKKDERRILIMKMAYDRARSGQYGDYMAIEYSLRRDGYTEARQLLEQDHIREELNRLCSDAKKNSN